MIGQSTGVRLGRVVAGKEVWLGRKDSNLQPSDPESAALPLRHSPSKRSGPAAYSSQRLKRRFDKPLSGRVFHKLSTPVVAPGGRLLPFLAAAPRRPPPRLTGAHSDRQRRRGPHQPIEHRFEEPFGLIQVDRPPHTEHPIAEQTAGVRVPVGRPYAFPGWRSKVIRNVAADAAMPCSFRFRLGQLGRDRSHDEPHDGESNQPA